MKKKILKKIESAVRKQYPNYNDDKISEIMYGIEGIYLSITKAIIIFIIAIIFNLVKELVFLLIAFNFARLYGFGMHANKSFICLILSSSLFIGGAFLCKYVALNTNVIIISFIVALVIMALYAPADTVKRPLIKKKKRIRYKIFAIIITLSYFIASLLIKNTLIVNSLVIGMLIECILILPVTYKIFKMPYRNYKKYGLSAS